MAAFGDRTTCHGLPNILNRDKHRLSRLLWLVLTLVAVCECDSVATPLALRYVHSSCIWKERLWFDISVAAMVVVVFLTVEHFLRDPVSATIREHSTPSLPFPAITICNLNKIKKEIQDEWDKKQRDESDYYYDYDSDSDGYYDGEDGNASSTNQSMQKDVRLNDFLRFLVSIGREIYFKAA